MLVFSDIHNWQNDAAVVQILVFPDKEAKMLFEREFAERIEKDGIGSASDSRIGAIYKLRAVKNGNDQYLPVLRGGDHAGLIWEGPPVGDELTALKEAMLHLYSSVMKVKLVGIQSHIDSLVARYVINLVKCEFGRLKKTYSEIYEIKAPASVL